MERLLRLLLTTGLISQSLCGCGWEARKESDALTKDSGPGSGASETSKDSVAMLYFGGFNSCSQVPNQGYPDNVEPLTPGWDDLGMSMLHWVRDISKAYGKPHQILVACYPFWTNVPMDGFKASSSKANQDSKQKFPGHVDGLNTNIYLRHNLAGTMIPTQKITLKELLSSLEAQLVFLNIKKVAILGHSYGGYTAMLVAKALSSTGSRINITSLTTLDPISMDTCQPQNIVDSLQKDAVPPGCHQAPAMGVPDNNLSLKDVKHLAATVPWTNIYQGADIYIHSSPIAVPGVENLEIIYSKDKNHGVVNHIMFLYPKEKTNPSWPGIAANVVQKVAKHLE